MKTTLPIQSTHIEKNNSKKPRIGLALSGGSTLGVAHIGALKALVENNIPIDCIAGTSVGSIVAAAHAFGVSTEKMIELAHKMRWKNISKLAYSPLGFASNKPIGTLITELLGDVDIKDAQIPLAVIAANIETGQPVVFRTGPVAPILRASSSIPGIFTPVEIDNVMLVDGGLYENIPLTPLDHMGADIKIAINLSAYPPRFRPKNVRDVFFLTWNAFADHRDARIKHAADVLIEPDLRNFKGSKFKEIDALLNAGYEAALAAIPLIHEEIADWHRIKKSKKFLAKAWKLLNTPITQLMKKS